MALLNDIVRYANDFLLVDRFKDYCPNGLQIEGRSEVKKIITGVTASMAMIEKAIEQEADALLVHHGFFWRGESESIVGLKKRRIAALIKKDLSLIAYHLPLDAHPTVGNNTQLAQRLELSIVGQFGDEKQPVGLITRVSGELTKNDLTKKLENALARDPLVLSASRTDRYRSIAICTGAAQNYFQAAIDAGADAFITGEASEQSFHLALESGVDFYSVGHHASERYGVQALGDHLARQFNFAHEFFDMPNPI